MRHPGIEPGKRCNGDSGGSVVRPGPGGSRCPMGAQAAGGSGDNVGRRAVSHVSDGRGRSMGRPPCVHPPRFRLRILREKCLDCAQGPGAVRNCEHADCQLFDHRMGHRPKGRKARRTPLKSLRAFCLWCCCDSSHEVGLCPCTTCALWPWRRGRSRNGEIRPVSTKNPHPASSSETRGTRQVAEVVRSDEVPKVPGGSGFEREDNVVLGRPHVPLPLPSTGARARGPRTERPAQEME